MSDRAGSRVSGQTKPVAKEQSGHPVCNRLLCHRLPETVLPRHPAVRDTRNDPEDKTAADGNGQCAVLGHGTAT